MPAYYVGTMAFGRNDLQHHGILGQKWGVRRFQNADGSLTPEGRERYGYGKAKDFKKVYAKAGRKYGAATAGQIAAIGGLTAAGAAAGVGVGIATNSTIGTFYAGYGGAYTGLLSGAVIAEKIDKWKRDYRENKNPVKLEQLNITPGTVFKRTSLNEKDDEQKRLYMSYSKDKPGIKYYTQNWPAILKGLANNPNAKVYQNTYKVTGQIVAPSYEKRKEIADVLIKADKKIKMEFGKTFALDVLNYKTGAPFAKRTLKELEKEIGPEVKKAYKEAVDTIVKDNKYSLIDDDSFRQFTAAIPRSEKLMDAYIKELKKNGYTAVFDDNSTPSLAPLIVFDQSLIEQTGSRELRYV